MTGRPPQPLANRFWSKVNIGSPDECWEWQGSINKSSGYGKFWVENGKDVGAHCMAYILSTGNDPTGLYICHSCDNKICCNPNHLWKGTPRDNAQDRKNKNRSFRPVGEKSVNAKLTWEKVNDIRKLSKTHTGRELAKMFMVCPSSISLILRNQTWVNVDI